MKSKDLRVGSKVSLINNGNYWVDALTTLRGQSVVRLTNGHEMYLVEQDTGRCIVPGLSAFGYDMIIESEQHNPFAEMPVTLKEAAELAV